MRFPIIAALTGLVLAVPMNALAQPAPAASASVAPVYAELAARVLSDDHTDAKVDGLIAATLKALTEADSDVADLDQQYPGLIAAVGNAMRPLMLRGVAQTMPAYRAELAEMYARNLTPAEARSFADFLARPGPRAFFGAVARQMNYNSMANDLVAERDISATSLSRDVRNTATQGGGGSHARAGQGSADLLRHAAGPEGDFPARTEGRGRPEVGQCRDARA